MQERRASPEDTAKMRHLLRETVVGGESSDVNIGGKDVERDSICHLDRERLGWHSSWLMAVRVQNLRNIRNGGVDEKE